MLEAKTCATEGCTAPLTPNQITGYCTGCRQAQKTAERREKSGKKCATCGIGLYEGTKTDTCYNCYRRGARIEGKTSIGGNPGGLIPKDAAAWSQEYLQHVREQITTGAHVWSTKKALMKARLKSV